MNSECGAELSFKVYSTLLRTFFMICSWSVLIEYLSLCKSIYLYLYTFILDNMGKIILRYAQCIYDA
jgi:hypothetical protein